MVSISAKDEQLQELESMQAEMNALRNELDAELNQFLPIKEKAYKGYTYMFHKGEKERLRLERFSALDESCIRALAIIFHFDQCRNWRQGSSLRDFIRSNQACLTVHMCDYDWDNPNIESSQLAIFESIINKADFEPKNMTVDFTKHVCIWLKYSMAFAQALKGLEPKRYLLRDKDIAYRAKQAELEGKSDSDQVML